MSTTLNQYEATAPTAGVNVSMLPEEIADNEAVVLQDMWVDRPGVIYPRTGIKMISTGAPNTPLWTAKKVRGMVSTAAPDGNTHTAAVSQDSAASALYFDLIADDGQSLGSTVTIDIAPVQTSDVLVDAKPALGGGVWVGVQEMSASVSLRGSQWLFHWRGANKPNYSTGTVTATQGTATVTGSSTLWAANAAPGMFLVDSTGKKLLGVVKQVNSNTSLTLEATSNWSLSGSYNLLTLRSWCQELGKGRLKTVAGSTTVVGAGTKLLSQNAQNYTFFRQRDNAIIGAIASAQGEEGATLASATSVTMDDEPYVGRSTTGHPDSYFTYILPSTVNLIGYPGVLNATYAGLQWFARQDAPLVPTGTQIGTGDLHSRVWFSDGRNMNTVDLTTADGDFIPVPSTVGQNLPIRGLVASAHALLVFKENETFAITGNEDDNFDLQKIWDDGCLCPMSIVQYKGTVIWAGRNGVYLFDGKKVENLVERSLGSKYVASVAQFDPRLHKICAVQFNDYYIFTVWSNGTPAIGGQPVLYTVMKNGTNTNVSGTLQTAAIYIPTKALTFQTFQVTATAKTTQSSWLMANTNVLTDFSRMFGTSTGADYNGVTQSASPDPYLESKRFSCTDPLRLKRFRQVILTYNTGVSSTPVEVAAGLVDSSLAGSWTLVNTLANSNPLEITARVKFHARERFVAFKIYSITSIGNAGKWELRRFALGYKWLDVGRV